MRKYCHYCGKEIDSLIPFKCRYCGNLFCKHHHLPENHNCSNLPPRKTLIKPSNEPLIKTEEPESSAPILESSSKIDMETKLQEKPKKQKKERRHRSYRPRIRLSNLAKIFWGSLIVFIILHLLLIEVSSRELWIIYIASLCVTEITCLLWLLFKLDRISVHTHLRLWGLRIIAGILAFFGIMLLFLIWFSSMLYMAFYPYADSTMASLSILPFLILGIGLAGIGAYLEFKFRRESGIIVYRG